MGPWQSGVSKINMSSLTRLVQDAAGVKASSQSINSKAVNTHTGIQGEEGCISVSGVRGQGSEVRRGKSLEQEEGGREGGRE